jgi:hypothetical protein
MHEIVAQNTGHSSPAFIKSLTELYVVASSDTLTSYAENPIENETIFETMRAHIADTLKLTPRRSQVPPAAASGGAAREAAPAAADDDSKTPVMARPLDADITANVSIGDLLPIDADEVQHAGTAGEAPPSNPAPTPNGAAGRPPPLRRGSRVRTPEGSA